MFPTNDPGGCRVPPHIVHGVGQSDTFVKARYKCLFLRLSQCGLLLTMPTQGAFFEKLLGEKQCNNSLNLTFIIDVSLLEHMKTIVFFCDETQTKEWFVFFFLLCLYLVSATFVLSELCTLQKAHKNMQYMYHRYQREKILCNFSSI